MHPEPLPQAAHQAAIDHATEHAAALRTRRSFLTLALAGLAGLVGWRTLVRTPDEDGIPAGLRRVLDVNARLSNAYYRPTRLAPEFAPSQARMPRANGQVGLGDDFDPATWRLEVVGYALPGTPPRRRQFSLEQLRSLPRTEFTTELKCIEGWSTIVSWAGVRLADLLARYPLATASERPIAAGQELPPDAAPYVSLTTPDGQYYVGLELASALHPQTLLCYEMNGRPLLPEHGAPLRLVTPLKYGIKHLKRIGTIAFQAPRPADYWAERGYDWHAGH